MCSACAPWPSESAARCSTPKRCCSSTTITRRRSNSTLASSSACVPTTSAASPEAMRCSRARRSAARQVAGHDGDLDPERLDELAHRRGVLLDEHLGRRQQRRLGPALGGAQHRVHGHDRLARADVAEQQAPHRTAAGEVAVDVAHAALLSGRERERQRRVVALEQLAGAPERLGLGGLRHAARPARPAAAAAPRRPADRRRCASRAASRGACSATIASRRSGSLRARRTPDRQRIGDDVGAREVLLDELAQDARRERARGVVDGHDAARVQPLPRLGQHLVLAHRQLEAAAGAHRGPQLQQLPGLERARQEALVEPDRCRNARVVPDARLDDPQVAAARRPHVHRDQLDAHRGLRARRRRRPATARPRSSRARRAAASRAGRRPSRCRASRARRRSSACAPRPGRPDGRDRARYAAWAARARVPQTSFRGRIRVPPVAHDDGGSAQQQGLHERDREAVEDDGADHGALRAPARA